MSIELMTAVWNSKYAKLRKNDKNEWVKSLAKLLVMLKLADHASDDGWCHPSQELIADKSNVSVRDVKRIIKELEQDGKLLIEHTKRQNRYMLLFRELDKDFDGVSCCHHVSEPDGVTSAQPRSDTNVTSIKPSGESPISPPKAAVAVAQVKDTRHKHPAIDAIRSLLKSYPNKELWDSYIQRFGDDVDVDRLRECFKEWVRRGWKPTNLKWVEWYFIGIEESYSRAVPTNGNGFADAGKSLAERAAEIEDDDPLGF